jgi:glutamyl-tRNA synthetase
MTVITRFAPSPTGYLHIGGARTALFNFLYSKKMGGKFLLRIEDTDLVRSTPEAVKAILNGLNWLGIKADEEPVFQMQRQSVHIAKAKELLAKGNAYKCYCTKEELDERRKLAEKDGKVYKYEGICRTVDQKQDKPYAIRVKSEREGRTIIKDLVLGEITVDNTEMDDFIILRSDEVPTYMFAVVVDDHDMNITHIIRGDDHLTNAFRQYQVYKAFGWQVPHFAHLPLIHSQAGGKMSKRHGAVAVENYKEMGFLPEAIKNYLLKLGWSHGDDEIISQEQAIEWFDVVDVNKAPAKFDIVKLQSINQHYIKEADNGRLIELMDDFLPKSNNINAKYKEYLLKGLNSIKLRSKTILELVENAKFYIYNINELKQNIALENKEILVQQKDIINQQIVLLQNIKEENWNKDNLHNIIKDFATQNNLKLGDVAKGFRLVLTGQATSAASNFEIMEILGKTETLNRAEITIN